MTYKLVHFRLSHQDNQARHRRARPQGCRLPGYDTETPLRHIRCLLHDMKRGVERKTEKMQHEGMALCGKTTCFNRKHGLDTQYRGL